MVVGAFVRFKLVLACILFLAEVAEECRAGGAGRGGGRGREGLGARWHHALSVRKGLRGVRVEAEGYFSP